MKRLNLARYAPPGHSTATFEALFAVLLMAELLVALSFFPALADLVRELEESRYAQFIETTFADLMAGRLMVLPIALMSMGAMAAINYLTFFQHSKSIYLMRRLPDRRELLRRTVYLPAMAGGVYLLLGAVLFGVSVLAYRLTIPHRYLPHDWVQSVLESITTLGIFGV